MTEKDIELARALTEEEYQKHLEVFNSILPELRPYIRNQANRRADKIPTAYVDEGDLERIGEAQVWIACLRWDAEKGSSLPSWAKRLIWTNMAVTLDDLYQRKRTARIVVAPEYVKERVAEYIATLSPAELEELHRRIAQAGNRFSRFSEEKQASYLAKELGLDVTLQTASLFDEVEEDVSLFETVEAPSEDPIGAMIADELFTKAHKELKVRGKRIAAAVLRLMVYPDLELVQLCESETRRKGRKQVHITNRCLALRLSATVSNIADAKALIRTTFKELSDD
jgi:hypothetical protein